MADEKGYPLPDGPISGYPLICVTLKIPDAPQYRQDFIGHIWELGKWWNWAHTGQPGDTRATQAAQYWRDLLYAHFTIGECPVDCCDDILAAIAALQTQTTTQGKLNLTRDVQQQQIESQRLRDLYQERYDGSPTSINPNAPTTDFGSSGDRYDALCAALMAFVYQFARAQVQSVVASDIVAFAALAGIAILLIPGLNLFYLAGASLALLAGGGLIGVTTATAAAALQDTAALNNVVCYMRDTLKAQSVTQANFAACLNSYPFATGSHEAIICDFIKPTLEQNYLGFLDMLGQGYSGLINGQEVPECPCEVPVLIPIIDPNGPWWDPGRGVCGTIVPDTDGYYLATATISGGAYFLGIAASGGQAFKVADAQWIPGCACWGYTGGDNEYFNGCAGNGWAATSDTMTRIAGGQGGSFQLRLKIVAP